MFCFRKSLSSSLKYMMAFEYLYSRIIVLSLLCFSISYNCCSACTCDLLRSGNAFVGSVSIHKGQWILSFYNAHAKLKDFSLLQAM